MFNPKKEKPERGYGPEEQMTTHQGGVGYAPSRRGEFLLLVAGSLFSGDTFYESDSERKERFTRLVSEVTREDPAFVASLAVYARQELGLRSGPNALVAHLFWEGPRNLAKHTASQVWLRGDEHLENLAYTKALGWKITNALKDAVAQRLNDMSPWALLKYKAEGRFFSQKDAIAISHPKPKDEEHALVFEYLVRSKPSRGAEAFVKETLQSRLSWERVLSEKGSNPEAWYTVLPHLDGLALVRNLRNLAKHGLLEDPEVIQTVVDKLSNPERVARWRVPPYGWVLAVKSLEEVGYGPEHPVIRALGQAMEASGSAVPLTGRTLVMVDASGSMYTPLSKNSDATYILAAASLGAFLAKATDGELYAFSNIAYRPESYYRGDVLGAVDEIMRWGGGGTYLERALRDTLFSFRGKRVVVITDEQVADNAYEPAFKWLRGDPERVFHVVHVAGYQPLAFPEGRVNRVAGFSDRVLDVLALMEKKDPVAWVGEYGEEKLGISRILEVGKASEIRMKL